MAKLILGIAGEMGSGKGTIAKYVLEKKEGSAYRFSTMLRDILDRVYLEQSRDNIQMLSTILRKNFGEDVLAKSMYLDVQKDERSLIVIDGVRRMADMKYLKEIPQFKLIYIETDIRNRHERIMKRGENSDDAKKTFEQFKKANEDESELQIRDLKNQANYVIDNNGNFEDLYVQVEKIIKENS